ncbi:hypothetical protein Tco_1209715 [Tanacetum coccineum]
MVACLERTDGNANFHKIVDFLTTSPIHYALTVSPTIYASYIEQFWNTAHSQTVNDMKQIHATVDGKTILMRAVFKSQMTDGKGLPLCLLALEAAQASGDRPRCQRKPLGVIALIALSQKGRYGQNLETQEGFGDGQEVSTAAQVSTASTFVSTSSPQRNEYTIADDLTLAETLMEIRKSDAKDKGKAKMDETESPRKMKQRERAQISRDEEVAQKLQE